MLLGFLFFFLGFNIKDNPWDSGYGMWIPYIYTKKGQEGVGQAYILCRAYATACLLAWISKKPWVSFSFALVSANSKHGARSIAKEALLSKI